MRGNEVITWGIQTTGKQPRRLMHEGPVAPYAVLRLHQLR